MFQCSCLSKKWGVPSKRKLLSKMQFHRQKEIRQNFLSFSFNFPDNSVLFRRVTRCKPQLTLINQQLCWPGFEKQSKALPNFLKKISPLSYFYAHMEMNIMWFSIRTCNFLFGRFFHSSIANEVWNSNEHSYFLWDTSIAASGIKLSLWTGLLRIK